MPNCEIQIKIGDEIIIVPNYTFEDANTLEKVVEKLYEDKEQFGNLVQVLTKKGYQSSRFEMSSFIPETQMGNYSLSQIIDKFFNSKLKSRLSNLGINVENSNILIVSSRSSSGNSIQNVDGELKYVANVDIDKNDTWTQNKLLNFIKLTIAHKTVSQNSDEDFVNELQKLYQKFEDFMKNKYKLTASNKRLKEVFKELNKIEDTCIKLSEFLLYVYGDKDFHNRLNGILKLSDKVSNLIDKHVNLNITDQIVLTDSKLESLVKNERIAIDDLIKQMESDNLTAEADQVAYLQDLLQEFNNNRTDTFLSIAYTTGKYFKLKVTKQKPVFDQPITLIGAEYYGHSTKLVGTMFGYNIVLDKYGKYIVDDQLLSYASEKRKGRRFDTLKAAKNYIQQQKRLIVDQYGKKTGSYMKTYGWHNALKFLKSQRGKLDVSNEKIRSRFSKGDVIKILDFNKFDHTFDELSKWTRRTGLPKEITYLDIVNDIEKFLERYSINDFFRDDAQKTKYKELLTTYEHVETFHLRAFDLVLSLIEANSELDKRGTLFTIPKEQRWEIIDQVLEELEGVNYAYYKVTNDPIQETVEDKTKFYVPVEKIDQETRVYKFPGVNIKQDLLQVVKHLQEHFGVNIQVINNEDIANGLEITDEKGKTKKIRFPKTNPTGKNIVDAKAFILNGQIYINIDNASANDVIHEYAHLALGILRAQNPNLYERLLQTLYQREDLPGLIESYRKKGYVGTEMDIMEEIFVNELGRVFGYKLSLGYYTDGNFEQEIKKMKDTWKKYIGQVFGLNTGFETSFVEELTNMSIDDVIEAFGSVILTASDNEFSDEFMPQILRSRKVSNTISRLMKAKPDKSEIYLTEKCE